jgi:hypothetical protein
MSKIEFKELKKYETIKPKNVKSINKHFLMQIGCLKERCIKK